MENSPAGTKKQTQLLQYLHTKETSVLQASDCRCWWCVTEQLHGIYRYNGSKCIEDKDAIQKYLSTDRKLEIYLQRQAHFYAKMSQIKNIWNKLGTLEIHIIRKKRKISVPYFLRKSELEKKYISTMIHTFPFHPQTKQHIIFTSYLCAASWPIKTLKKAIQWTELQ